MMDTCKRGRGKWRVVMIVVVTVVLFLASGTAGYAWWQLQGKATITASAGTLEAPELVCGGITVDLNDVERSANFRWGYKCYIWPKNSEVTEYIVRDSLNDKTKILRKGEVGTDRNAALVFRGPWGPRKPGPNDDVSVFVAAKHGNWYSSWATTEPLKIPEN